MDDLTTLLHDAVEDVEPGDRLDAIRERTRQPSRTRWYAAGGALLAAAAVMTGIALVTGPSSGPGPGPAQDPTATSAPTRESPRPIYYVGDTAAGPRLFRYFEPVRGGEPDHGTGTVIGLLMATPSDPDYRTLWPPDSLESLRVEDGLATVTLRDDSVHDRPAGMSAEEASLAVQQVIYTVQAMAQERVPVQFELAGNPIDQVFGVPTGEPLANDPPLDVLSHVNISDPAEGRVVEDSFTAEGVASSFEANVAWELWDSSGVVVAKDATIADGWLEERLFPWRTSVDVSGLPAGRYTFVAYAETSGADDRIRFTDTRTVVVR